MKERPVLFSGPMVRAILDGRKIQTRRVIKPQPRWEELTKRWLWWARRLLLSWRNACHPDMPAACKLGIPGDRLWVRETWFPMQDIEACALANEPIDVAYKADYDAEGISREEARDVGIDRWRPSIFMPRWVSRITLEITGVRVERVQDITAGDAIDEMVEDVTEVWEGLPELPGPRDFVTAFARLWDSLNAKRGFGWDVNPWVWVIGFRRVDD